MSGVHYTYPNGHTALSGVSLKVLRGEKAAILGPNGAGKSTLVMVAGGLLKPSRGSVRLFGVETFSEEFREIRCKVGIVFQDPDDQLFCPTLWEDVTFGPRNMSLHEEEVVRRGKAALADVGLMGYEERAPHRLSVGEKKKATIATALALEPEILLLDEPTANLEPKAKIELVDLLNTMHATRKITLLISTHDVEAVPHIAERIFILNDGQILAEGEKRKVFSSYSLLRSCRLEPPTVAKLFTLLGERLGLNFDPLPLTIQEGSEKLAKLLEELSISASISS